MKNQEEAYWAISEMKNQNLVSEEDTSIIFQSWNALDKNLSHLNMAFQDFNALHCVAIKTNPQKGVLKRIVDLGFGLEAASIEEIEMAFSVGISPSKLVFDSPVKTRREILRCHTEFQGIIVNVNSLDELKRIPKNPNFELGLRINPLKSSDSPEIYDVSSKESKFGVPIDDEENILKAILDYPITLIHVHIGSSLSDIEKSTNSLRDVFELIVRANKLLGDFKINRKIDAFDIGGGLKAELLNKEENSLMMKYAKMLEKKIPELKDYKIITEFGQWVHFHTGYCWSTIEYVVCKNSKQILFTHLGADFFLRDAYTTPRELEFHLISKENKENMELKQTDIAGPLCFAGDYIARDISFNKSNEGDELLIIGTGSNTYGLWSRHCSRTIPKIVAVDFKNKSLQLLSNRTKINF